MFRVLNFLLADIDLHLRASGLHIDRLSKHGTSSYLNGVFMTDGIRCMLVGNNRLVLWKWASRLFLNSSKCVLGFSNWIH